MGVGIGASRLQAGNTKFGYTEDDECWSWKLGELKLKTVTEYNYLGTSRNLL